MENAVSANPDGTITVNISGTFTADEIREAIEQLCHARAQAAQDSTNPQGQRVLMKDDAAWVCMPIDGRPALMQLVTGFGWVGTLLTHADALKLAAVLVQHEHNCIVAATAATATSAPTGDEPPPTSATGGGAGSLH